ncbi:MAG: OmpH family outer membrane protein [Bacteroidia bacterium]|nr:OmpH family outer membrane protein [Bacteroidia bacterium]MCC7534065.1 OmpH family outer membrane protein [Bacteroidia bacterium]MCZ2140934.1 OmpH family outer membrane protein [Bacteroidia bacterium]
MKKTILTLALSVSMIFGALQLKAQNKFAYVDFHELMTSMPEYKKAQSEMEVYSKTLQEEGKKLSTEFETKLAAYQKEGAKLNEIQKELREKDLRDLQTRYQEFQEMAQSKQSEKEQSLLKPIVEKAKATISTVAKEGGYSYVFDSSPGSPILYKPDGDNIIGLVKKKLGIM